MTDEELFDALDGLFAYDTGCVDSGIHDEALRKRVKEELAKDVGPYQIVGPRLSAFAKTLLDPPYGLEDVANFIKWLANHMDIEL